MPTQTSNRHRKPVNRHRGQKDKPAKPRSKKIKTDKGEGGEGGESYKTYPPDETKKETKQRNNATRTKQINAQ
jgi:hypothetical protein